MAGRLSPETLHRRRRAIVSSEGPLIAIFLIVGIAAFVFWVWTIVDVVRVPDDSMFKAGNKLVWVLVVVITGVLGAIIYLVVGRPVPGGRPGLPPSASPNQTPPPPPGTVG
jgi:hypothetical protein